ncbi:hypothetical protein KIN20_024818 [Parelaphostrongylus tenuis]|uniref:Uncharacterized protein n=1 Tax=Parelaphostrongylus tenuis TaxID=148309 RepID=A0AAD5MU41_PARTN|nr:hypothetical protein KIN20_024818 [Parelaphostrongylus tenuis]
MEVESNELARKCQGLLRCIQFVYNAYCLHACFGFSGVFDLRNNEHFAEASHFIQSFSGESRWDEEKNYKQAIAKLRDEIQVGPKFIFSVSIPSRHATPSSFDDFQLTIFRYYRPAQERAATAKNPDVEELEKKVRELKEKHCQLILEKPKLQQVSNLLISANDSGILKWMTVVVV